MTDGILTEHLPVGYGWRSSKQFVTFTIGIALFTESLLYGFIVPILTYILEHRLRLDASQTQNNTTKLLATYGFVALVSAPVTAHFADKVPNKRAHLLMALSVCIIGTLLVASTPSVWALYLGRVLQAVASSGAWIAGFATLADAAGPDHEGTAMGVALSFSTAGTIAGPTISGALLRLVGYWPTWTVPIVALAIDLIARLVMIDPRSEASSTSASDSPAKFPADLSQEEERACLLATPSDSYQSMTPDTETSSIKDKPETRNFYRTMLSTSGVLTGLAGCLLYTILITSFENTIPLHVRDTFGWGSLPAGLMFLCLQAPNIILGPVSGRVRDHVGTRYPAAVGWAIMAPLLWLLGTPGDPRFPWADAKTYGPVITISCLIGVGAFGSLVQGAGPMEFSAVVRKWESPNPQVFGPNGAGSRVFALAETAFTLGIMLGPILSGSLLALVGYSNMNMILAIICLIVSVASFCFLSRNHRADFQHQTGVS